MAKGFISFLDKIGADFKKGLPIFNTAVTLGAIGVGAAEPQLQPLISTGLAVIQQTEQKFAAMGQQSGTGPQKLAEATNILAPIAVSLMGSTGSSESATSQVSTWVNALVAVLNSWPAAATTPAPTTVAA